MFIFCSGCQRFQAALLKKKWKKVGNFFYHAIFVTQSLGGKKQNPNKQSGSAIIIFNGFNMNCKG